jgi:DNA-binding CsgD family transcriptional regulator
MKGDVLSVIEAAYAECDGPDAWISNVLGAIAPHIDRGQGVMVCRFAHEPTLWTGAFQATGALGEVRDVYQGIVNRYLAATPAEDLAVFAEKVYPRAPTVAWVSELLGQPWHRTLDSYLAEAPGHLRPTLELDAHGVVAGEPSGRGCVFFAAAPRAVPMQPQVKALWESVAAHLVTGYRLAGGDGDAPDAVLAPDGRVVHRESAVTQEDSASLTYAARAIDRARGRLRRTDEERALAIWKALVAGRWSLVDHFDHDGRRYVVARRNSPEVRPWELLTEREAQVVAFAAHGQSFKLIAYQLGISVATVSTDFARAQAKVGARGRIDLVAAYRADRSKASSA